MLGLADVDERETLRPSQIQSLASGRPCSSETPRSSEHSMDAAPVALGREHCFDYRRSQEWSLQIEGRVTTIGSPPVMIKLFTAPLLELRQFFYRTQRRCATGRRFECADLPRALPRQRRAIEIPHDVGVIRRHARDDLAHGGHGISSARLLRGLIANDSSAHVGIGNTGRDHANSNAMAGQLGRHAL